MKLNIGQFSNWFLLLAVLLIHLLPKMEGLIGISAQYSKDRIKRDNNHNKDDKDHFTQIGKNLENSQFMQSNRKVGVVAPLQLLEQRNLKQGFQIYINFLNLSLPANLQVDFLPDNGWSSFLSILEQSNYQLLVKVLEMPYNNDISDVYQSNVNRTRLDEDATFSEMSACPFTEVLTHLYNKSFTMWPCPSQSQNIVDREMHFIGFGELITSSKSQSKSKAIPFISVLQRKRPENPFRQKEGLTKEFPPSDESIALAVKSIALKLNWQRLIIFTNDEFSSLPIMVAATLQIVTYDIRFPVIEHFNKILHDDREGNAILISTSINNPKTLELFDSLCSLVYTKLLLIDLAGVSFNVSQHFYQHLSELHLKNPQFISNLLILTAISDNYRYLLNKKMFPSIYLNTTHLDDDVLLENILAKLSIYNNSNDIPLKCPVETVSINQDEKIRHINNRADKEKSWLQQICRLEHNSLETFINDCLKWSSEDKLTTNLMASLNKWCDLQIHQQNSFDETLLSDLENVMDFINFYDYLIDQLKQFMAQHNFDDDTNRKKEKNKWNFFHKNNHNWHLWSINYNFIVLEVLTKPKLPLKFPESFNKIKENFSEKDNNNRNFSNRTDFEAHSSLWSWHSETKLREQLSWRPVFYLTRELTQSADGLNSDMNYITYKIEQSSRGQSVTVRDSWRLFVNESSLYWHCGVLCWSIIGISATVILLTVVVSVVTVISLRNYFIRKRLSKGPNKIVLSPNDFVFPVDTRRVDEGIEAMLCCWLQQLQEFGGPEVEKPDLLKGSISSLKNLGFFFSSEMSGSKVIGCPGNTLNSPEISDNVNAASKPRSGSGNSLGVLNPGIMNMRARYNGDWVHLKEVSATCVTELKTKAMDLLVLAHGLRHENINPLIGWLPDPTRTAMVFDCCSRGSLQDVLIMDDIKLDWSFRLSLLTDLVRGMRYLHASPLHFHGSLTSRNCVVDARWVLKITDYVLPLFYEAQGIPPPSRTTKELLWTAPELLRDMKIHTEPGHSFEHTLTPHQSPYYQISSGGCDKKTVIYHHHSRLLGSQAGDVYSFSIIMQEVVVRGEPYCMLSLSADEIIAKIKKPPPLIRPSVSKGAAPPEAINIMRQCWAEQPEMRPDFNLIYERFKLLNHGRKVNFIDTMFQMLEKYSNNLEELIRERTEQLDLERKKTEQLLNRMLPSSVAEKLKLGLAVEPEEFADVTIYFSDIVGFTTIAAHCTPVQVVDLLNDLYTIFDATINAYSVYKVETIGDAYMVVSGLPVKIPDHAEQIATMALDLLHQSGQFKVKHLPGVPLQLRIGLHTGPCCAGVVGLTMPRYCLFGDTVNTASRMESSGSSWRIHLSEETKNRLEACGGYTIESRGLIDIKGKGRMHTYWLLGKKGFDKMLPNPPPIGESHGLDENLLKNSINLKTQGSKSRSNTILSTSQSTSSLTSESTEVKVEITPASNNEYSSIPLDPITDANNLSSNRSNFFLDYSASSHSSLSNKPLELKRIALKERNPCYVFNRLPGSVGSSSTRIYKKIEEMTDMSTPYNHYKCLSPSESNLSQFKAGGLTNISGTNANTQNLASNLFRFERPGSSRLLRRQYSLDRDDYHRISHIKEIKHLHQYLESQFAHVSNYNVKGSTLTVPSMVNDYNIKASVIPPVIRLHRQSSSSIGQDLEKIEEIPMSPGSPSNHQWGSVDSELNKTPPTGDKVVAESEFIEETGTVLFSAPTSPILLTRPIINAGTNTVHPLRSSVKSMINSDISTSNKYTTIDVDDTSTSLKNKKQENELKLNLKAFVNR